VADNRATPCGWTYLAFASGGAVLAGTDVVDGYRIALSDELTAILWPNKTMFAMPPNSCKPCHVEWGAGWYKQSFCLV
jgi:hypothetical protein